MNKRKYYLERVNSSVEETISLENGIHIVGRSQTANIIVRSKFCNRKCCELIVTDDAVRIFIEKVENAGGVYINQIRFKNGICTLQENDLIGFGIPTYLDDKILSTYGDLLYIYKLKHIKSQVYNVGCKDNNHQRNSYIQPNKTLPAQLYISKRDERKYINGHKPQITTWIPTQSYGITKLNEKKLKKKAFDKTSAYNLRSSHEIHKIL